MHLLPIPVVSFSTMLHVVRSLISFVERVYAKKRRKRRCREAIPAKANELHGIRNCSVKSDDKRTGLTAISCDNSMSPFSTQPSPQGAGNVLETEIY